MSVVVATDKGPVAGVIEDDLLVFRGIPYAMPPTGERRCRRPVVHTGWDEVLDCSRFRSGSLQSGVTPPGGMDEDCLYLNVSAPGRMGPGERLPVYVWIHGGGFMTGSASEPLYDPVHLVGDECIVVTINYRLGAMGFLHCEGGDANCGLWDQVAALQWIQQNIAGFGGDPNRVTIGGESAGGSAVTCLMASAHANTLFQQAIIMSGVAHTCAEPAVGRLFAAQFAASLGLANASLAAFQSVPADQWLSVQAGLSDAAPQQDFYYANNTPGWQGPVLAELAAPYAADAEDGIHFHVPSAARAGPLAHTFMPVVDGELLTEHPLDAIARGVAAHLNVIVGSNREENAFRPDPDHPGVTAPLTYGAETPDLEQAIARCEWFFQGWGRLEHLGGARAIAQQLVATYAETEAHTGGAAEAGSAQHIYNRLASDLAFNASTVMVAARQAVHRPKHIWVYRFDGFNNRNAFHGWELPLKFGHWQGRNPADEKISALMTSMRRCLTNFIRVGNPNGAPRTPAWPPWEAMHADLYDGPVLHFDRAARYVDTYREAAPGITLITSLLDAALGHDNDDWH